MAFVHKILNTVTQSSYILEIDIKKCFDSIDHEFIMENILVNKKILKQCLDCGVMENKEPIYYEEYGVPQGGIISPIICNFALNGFEALMKEKVKLWSKKKNQIFSKDEIKGLGFCRFTDDMVIIANNINLIHSLKFNLIEFLKIRGLKINENKTKITHINDVFKFVGFFYRRFLYKKPRTKTITSYSSSRTYMMQGKILVQTPEKKYKEFLNKIKLNIQQS